MAGATPNKPITAFALSEVHKISTPHLIKWQKEGVDIHDSRQVVKKIFGLQTKPPDWRQTYSDLTAGSADDSEAGLKRQKLKAEVEKIQIGNDKAKGILIPRDECEQVMTLWVSALMLRFTQTIAMLPPQLEGLDAAGIEQLLADEFGQIQSEFADDKSNLWKKINDKTNEPPDDDVGEEAHKATAKNVGRRVVSQKRKAGKRAVS